MKAREYFNKYDSAILEESKTGGTSSLCALLNEMIDESESILKKRGCVRDSAVIALIKEANQKWNAICTLYEHKYGFSPLKYNGFWNNFARSIPELGGKI